MPTFINVNRTFAESLAKFITNPVVVPILLSIASLGLVLELYSPGFGLPGGMGISCITAYSFMDIMWQDLLVMNRLSYSF